MKRWLPLLAVALLLAGVGYRVHRVRKAAAARRINACIINIRELGTAQNWYAIDNDGFPTPDLQKLIPIHYTKARELPQCGGQGYQVEVAGLSYTLYCRAGHLDYPLEPHYPYCSTATNSVIVFPREKKAVR